MPFTKSSSSGKKQASMPSPNSPAYKKLLAAQRSAPAKNSDTPGSKSGGKPSKAFSSLRSRQRIVELVKRAIWAKVREINDSIINLALAGNYLAAKALFDFAGVYSLPTPEQEPPTPALAATDPALAAAPVDDPELTNPINAFFRSIGVEPPCSSTSPLAAENA
ncbi:MAG: hypothetical protein WB555_03495 [Candidatus Korobacteraceae bacterium]